MPFDIELDTTELEDIARRLPGLSRKIDGEIRRTLGVSMEFLQSLAKTITREKDLVDTAKYLNSISYAIHGTPPDMHGTLAPSIRYGVFVERGRGPGGFPNLSAIQLWVRRKLGIGDDEEARSVAFLIGRAIARRGTIKRFGYDGGRVIEATADRGERDVVQFFQKMIDQIAREIESL